MKQRALQQAGLNWMEKPGRAGQEDAWGHCKASELAAKSNSEHQSN